MRGMVEPGQQLQNLREIEEELHRALGATNHPRHLSRYYELLREVQRQIREVESALLEC
jgi:hypothetical protein